MTPIEKLETVLCDPNGKVCIAGSDADRALAQEALAELRKQHDEDAAEIERLTAELEATREEYRQRLFRDPKSEGKSP
jgi:uncharacterized protein involved in exopolysaccharide biosynthesis